MMRMLLKGLPTSLWNHKHLGGWIYLIMQAPFTTLTMTKGNDAFLSRLYVYRHLYWFIQVSCHLVSTQRKWLIFWLLVSLKYRNVRLFPSVLRNCVVKLVTRLKIRCTDIRSHGHSFPRGFWQGRTFVLTSNDHPGHSCSHQITTPDIRAHIKLSVAVVGPGVHPEGHCYVRDGDLQGPEGAVEGETSATWNQSTPEGNEEALPGGSGRQQVCCPVPIWGWTLHQDPYMNSVSVSV